MIAKGFKPVAWVAAVGGAALSCYLVSLQVATERNELERLERQIIATKQEMRTLQTELGTRGRLSQLESWNAEVLALSAPVSGQFVGDAVTLARFDQTERSFEERAQVRMASMNTGTPPAPAAAAPVAPPAAGPAEVRMALAPSPAPAQGAPIIHRASYTPAPAEPKAKPAASMPKAAEAKPAASAPKRVEAKRPGPLPAESANASPTKPRVKPKPGASRLGDGLAAEIGAAARAESKAGAR
jgi:hypothetical protein